MRRFLVLVIAAAAAPAAACGFCLEDKIASAYDHAVVVRAVERKHHVAFLHVEGSAPRRALEQALRSTPGVDAGTARVSADLATVSLAYDPKRAALGAIQSRAERRLAGYKVSLMPLQVMERLADLKVVESAPGDRSAMLRAAPRRASSRAR